MQTDRMPAGHGEGGGSHHDGPRRSREEINQAFVDGLRQPVCVSDLQFEINRSWEELDPANDVNNDLDRGMHVPYLTKDHSTYLMPIVSNPKGQGYGKNHCYCYYYYHLSFISERRFLMGIHFNYRYTEYCPETSAAQT